MRHFNFSLAEQQSKINSLNAEVQMLGNSMEGLKYSFFIHTESNFLIIIILYIIILGV